MPRKSSDESKKSKKEPVLPKPPKPSKIDKSFKKNTSSDIIPANPPRSLTWNGNHTARPYDYLVGVTSIGPQVSVLPPSYMAPYASMIANRAQVLSSFEIEQERAAREAAFISRQLNALENATYKSIQVQNNLPKYAATPADYDMPEEEFEHDDISMYDAFSTSSISESIRSMQSVVRQEGPPEFTMEEASEAPPKQTTNTAEQTTFAEAGTSMEPQTFQEAGTGTETAFQEAGTETETAFQEAGTQYEDMIQQGFMQIEDQLQDANERARKRKGSELMNPDNKRYVTETYKPSNTEISHVLTAIRASSSYQEAQKVLSDFMNSYSDRGIELDIGLDKMARLSTEVSIHSVRDNIHRLEAELARNPYSATRRAELQKELRTYRSILSTYDRRE